MAMNSRTEPSSAERLASAENTLLALLYPKSEADMTPGQRIEFDLAVEEQAAFLASPAGRAASSAAGRIASESVGDVSVSYRVNGAGRFAAGEPVSPQAEARLLRCGLLGRWV